MAPLDSHAALRAAKVGPGRALSREYGPPAPQGVGGELPPPAGRAVDATGRRGSHAGRCAPPPGGSTSATSSRPRTTRMSSGTCRRPPRRLNEKAGVCGTSPEAQPHAHISPRHPASVHAQTPAAPKAPREPRTPHSTTRLTPQLAAPPPSPATESAIAAERHAEPRPEKTKRTGSRWTPTRTPTGTATPNSAEPKPAAVGTG